MAPPSTHKRCVSPTPHQDQPVAKRVDNNHYDDISISPERQLVPPISHLKGAKARGNGDYHVTSYQVQDSGADNSHDDEFQDAVEDQDFGGGSHLRSQYDVNGEFEHIGLFGRQSYPVRTGDDHEAVTGIAPPVRESGHDGSEMTEEVERDGLPNSAPPGQFHTPNDKNGNELEGRGAASEIDQEQETAEERHSDHASDDEKRLEEDDLFASTFGNSTSTKNKDESDNESIIDVTDEQTKDPVTHSFDQAGHVKGCAPQAGRRFSTPPPPRSLDANKTAKPKPKSIPITTSSTTSNAISRLATNKKKHIHTTTTTVPSSGKPTFFDISKNLRAHYNFHDRVLNYIPQLPAIHRDTILFPWPIRRYWIAIMLHPSRNARNVSSAKDFLWMKGNKLTSVRTAWTAWCNFTFAADANAKWDDEEEVQMVMMMGHERVRWEDTMEELDKFGDRLCVFRVVKKGDQGWKGKSFLEGLNMPEIAPEVEVIELD